MRTLSLKVAGVTFENRQEIIAQLSGGESVQFRPEPENAFDRNAIAIYVAGDGINSAKHIGYVPRVLASEIAPYMEGENFYGQVKTVTGGFEKSGGEYASFGVIVTVLLPDDV